MVIVVIAFLAGMVTVLAPCVLPILPVVLGASVRSDGTFFKNTLPVIGSLVISILIFTYLLKVASLLISVPGSVLTVISGVVILIVGSFLVFPEIWDRTGLSLLLNRRGGEIAVAGKARGGLPGSILVGSALGLVFSSCSPAYLFIVATIIPADLAMGTLYLLAYVAGLASSLMLIALVGGPLIQSLMSRMGTIQAWKRAFGVVLIIFGLLIATGYEKKAETWILEQAPVFTIKLEDDLVQQFVRPSYE